MKINVLAESYNHITSTHYPHQVFKTLQKNFDVSLYTMNDVRLKNKIKNDDQTISFLKLRNIDRNIPLLKDYLENKPISVYEEDPWESFVDNSQWKGSYQRIYSELNVKTYLNTTSFWSEHANSKGIPSKFIRASMLPEYSVHTKWEDKDINLGFCGSVHPWRREFFNFLETKGLKVKILPMTNYQDFLKTLSRIKIFLFCEKINWTVDGEKFPVNAKWIRCIEACSRGCISLREFETESYKHASKEDVPAKLAYQNFDDAVYIINEILCKPNDYMNLITESSVDYIKNNLNWSDIITAIK